MKRRLEAIEMWLWRRMLRIPWTDLKTNDEVLTLAGERRNLMNDVFTRAVTLAKKSFVLFTSYCRFYVKND